MAFLASAGSGDFARRPAAPPPPSTPVAPPRLCLHRRPSTAAPPPPTTPVAPPRLHRRPSPRRLHRRQSPRRASINARRPAAPPSTPVAPPAASIDARRPARRLHRRPSPRPPPPSKPVAPPRLHRRPSPHLRLNRRPSPRRASATIDARRPAAPPSPPTPVAPPRLLSAVLWTILSKAGQGCCLPAPSSSGLRELRRRLSSGAGERDPDLRRHERVGRHRLEVGPASCGVGPAAERIFSGTRNATWWVPRQVQCDCDWIQAKISWFPSVGRQAAGQGAAFFTTKTLSHINILLSGSHGRGLQCLVLYLRVFLYFRIMHPSVLPSMYPSRQLLLCRWLDDYASTRVFGSTSYNSDNDINIILRLPASFNLDSSAGPCLTDAMRGQTIRVHASLTPL